MAGADIVFEPDAKTAEWLRHARWQELMKNEPSLETYTAPGFSSVVPLLPLALGAIGGLVAVSFALPAWQILAATAAGLVIGLVASVGR